MKRISDVFGDATLLQILLHHLCGNVYGLSLALPNGQLKQLGMRCVVHLLTSCKQLTAPHRGLTCQWRAQFQLDDQYEAELEAKHSSFYGSSPESDGSESEYYTRLQNDSSNLYVETTVSDAGDADD